MVDVDEDKIRRRRERLERVELAIAAWEPLGGEMPEEMETMKAEAQEQLRKAQLKRVAVHLNGDGCAVVLAKGSHLWLRPADSSKKKVVRQ